MNKVLLFSGTALIVTGLFMPPPALPQGYTVDKCVSSATGVHRVNTSWQETRGGRRYNCRCDARQGLTCTPAGSPISPTLPSGGLSPSQQVAIGVFGALFQGAFSGIFDEPSPANAPGKTYAEQMQQVQEEQRNKEIQLAIDAWKNVQEKAARDALESQQRQKVQGANLVGRMIGGGLTGGSGKLEPMWIGSKQELDPAPSGGYQTRDLTAVQRLLCTSYFSNRAFEETRKNNDEGMRFFSDQADRVMSGEPADAECKFPELPEVPLPSGASATEMDSGKFTALINGFNLKLKQLQEIQADLNEKRKEKSAARQNLIHMEERVREYQAQAQAVQRPEDRADVDARLQQALASKADVENQVSDAERSEQELMNKARDMAKDINAAFKSIEQ